MTPSIHSIIYGTAADLAMAAFSSNENLVNYLPSGVVLFESDTKRLKISNGTTTTYAALPYVIEEQFTPELKAILDGANTADGVVVPGADGLISETFIPSNASSTPIVVRDIAGRDAIATEDRTNIVVVRDASGDPTVVGGTSTSTADDYLLVAHFDGSIDNATSSGTTAEVISLDGKAHTAVFSTTPGNKIFGTSGLLVDATYAIKYTLGYPMNAGIGSFRGFFRPQGIRLVDQPLFEAYDKNGAIQCYVAIEANSGNLVLAMRDIAAWNVVTGEVNPNFGDLIVIGSYPLMGALPAGEAVYIAFDGSNQILYCDGNIAVATPDELITGVRYGITDPITSVIVASNYIGGVDEVVIDNYIAPMEPIDPMRPTGPFGNSRSGAITSSFPAAASYVWDTTANDWVKIGEHESIDVDFSGFVKGGDALDRITDGLTYVRFTTTERTQLATMISTLANLTNSWTTKVTEITGRYDAIETRQDAVDARLVALEAAVADQDNHILRDTDVVEFNGFTVSRWSA